MKLKLLDSKQKGIVNRPVDKSKTAAAAVSAVSPLLQQQKTQVCDCQGLEKEKGRNRPNNKVKDRKMKEWSRQLPM